MHYRTLRLLTLALVTAALGAQEVKRTFAVRMEGSVIGHMTETEVPAIEAGRKVIRLHSRTVVKVELLGASIDQIVDQKWVLAADSRKPIRVDARHETGPQKIELRAKLGASGWEFEDGREPVDPAEVIFAPDLRWLRDRGPKQPDKVVEAKMMVPEVGAVHSVRVELADNPERDLDVLGQPRAVRVFVVTMPGLGVSTTMFVDRETYELLRYELPAQGMVVDRAPESVVERIQRIDMTNQILAKTNLDVEDPSKLTFMRLHAVIDSTEGITVESLNVPGQTFKGTVKDGHIVGEFTIRSHRCNADKAPAFPVEADTFATPELAQYLQPSENIESDDPALSKKARELAAGATNCVQVLERLAKWAYDEIPYVIPGGGSAKRTFALREGECGGHSRVLAAMLRANGIPARTPMGGMYVPLYGGSFGQHMWTEVWLGDEIGWLPVDCTAGQSTFLDAGHIRLSDDITAFSPKEIRVLDHEPKQAKVAAARRTDAMPLMVDKPLVYLWTQASNELGEETVTYRGRKDGAHVIDNVVTLSGGQFKETTRTSVGDDGRLIGCHCEQAVAGQSSTIDIAMADGKVTIKQKSKEVDKSNSMDVDPAMFVLHNNCTAHFLVAVNRAGPFTEGGEYKVRFLHSTSQALLSMTMTAKGLEEIAIGDRKVQARAIACVLAGLAIELHVDDQGRILRYHQTRGDVTIELKQLP